MTGPRCFCGHYEREHNAEPLGNFMPANRCTGAYATLAADEDHIESVEVPCPCQRFRPAPEHFHDVRP